MSSAVDSAVNRVTGTHCAGLVLAAGAGRRMGGPKALVRLGGRLLVERAAAVLRDAGCAPVVVVLGAEADRVRAEADLSGVDVVVNPDWPEGMGSSLRCGLAACAERGAEAAVVSLVDQPGLGPAVVTRLIEAWRRTGSAAVVATYEGQPRNPVLLAAPVWAAVAEAATGDVGARGWLRTARRDAPDTVLDVECGDLGYATDLDTPADLADLAELEGRSVAAQPSA